MSRQKIDLKNVFDTINHSIFLETISSDSVRDASNDFIKSYLTNRAQFVELNYTYSRTLGLTCGVSQGSVWGSLLFLLYINDPETFFKGCNSILFVVFFSQKLFSHSKTNWGEQSDRKLSLSKSSDAKCV